MPGFLKIYGERKTNTNGLEKLVDLNPDFEQLPDNASPFNEEIQKRVSGNEFASDLNFFMTQKFNFGLRHSRPGPIEQLKNCPIIKLDVKFLAIKKYPCPRLLYLYRRPYHSHFRNVEMDFETFLASPWRTFRRENALELRGHNGRDITSESCIESPENLINTRSPRKSRIRPGNFAGTTI